MCIGGVLQDAVPQPADQVWQAAPPPPLPPHSLCLRHRAALLRETRRQDPHRDPDKGHAALWVKLPVAVNVDGRLQHVTQRPPAPGVRDVCLMSPPLVANCPTTKAPNSQSGAQIGVNELLVRTGYISLLESFFSRAALGVG